VGDAETRRLGAQRVGETWPWRAAGWPQRQEAGGVWTWRQAGRRAASCREGSRRRGEPERRGRGPRPRRGRRNEEEEDDRFKPMPELKLRPILTKPPGRADAGAASDSSSAAASPSPAARSPGRRARHGRRHRAVSAVARHRAASADHGPPLHATEGCRACHGSHAAAAGASGGSRGCRAQPPLLAGLERKGGRGGGRKGREGAG